MALALVAAGPRPAAAQQAQNSSVDDLRAERTRGRADAPVTIYEISDFQCPFCARFWRETLPAIERDYIATGKVRLIFVNMPITDLHANSEPAAELAMCAARQHKFWQMHDLLFRNQDRWADLKDPAPYFLSLGDSLHANQAELLDCLRTRAMRSVLISDVEGSRRSGAGSTPTFYVQGADKNAELIVGAQDFSLFKSVLDSIIGTKPRG